VKKKRKQLGNFYQTSNQFMCVNSNSNLYRVQKIVWVGDKIYHLMESNLSSYYITKYVKSKGNNFHSMVRIVLHDISNNNIRITFKSNYNLIFLIYHTYCRHSFQIVFFRELIKMRK
jgi:hypothetical protein